MTMRPEPYTGPVPLVTHLHGSHVNPESDGYPEAWWLPAANNIPAGYVTKGGIFDQFNKSNTVPGSAFYGYENTQPATTLWYHDHALGMTRLNVYAGPAGFWVIRGGANGDEFVDDVSTPAISADGVLPGPRPQTVDVADPNFDPAVRAAIREIPIVIQDRTFKDTGDLFYPDNRAYFEGLNIPGATQQFPGEGVLDIPFVGDMTAASDIAPIWNPEAFFHTMVVNGNTWPSLDVAPALYRFRLLNGCNSRFINLSLVALDATDAVIEEVPFYMLGAEQGFYAQVVRIVTGEHVLLTPGAAEPPVTQPISLPGEEPALGMGPAVRADVLVDFSRLPPGTVKVRMLNTGPDTPFGGFPIDPLDLADPATTGQVMEFVLNGALLGTSPTDPGGVTPATAPANLALPAEPSRIGDLVDNTRQLSLNEEVSEVLCVNIDPTAGITLIAGSFPPDCLGGGEPFGPKAALLGTVDTGTGTAIPLQWMAAITEDPILGDTEVWEIFNMTMDAHPIHLHLVRFEVVNRQALQTVEVMPGMFEPIPVVDAAAPIIAPHPWETGFRDMVTANPGEVTRIQARFDIVGLYVWHCHIVEHEDNEMMRPYVVRFDPAFPDINGDGAVDRNDLLLLIAEARKRTPKNPGYDLNGDGKVDMLDVRTLVQNYTP
jgi:FtsP/CotA-like multicopper oxidase with cupredoxin domain